MSPVASPMYRSIAAVRSAQPSAATVMHDPRVARKILCFVAETSRDEEYRQAISALMISTQHRHDEPNEADLVSRNLQPRFPR